MQSILDWWQNFWEHAQFWGAFWPAIWGAVVGAVAAVRLERHYREKQRISREVGECNKLIFVLGQMLSTLENTNEALFVAPQEKLGRPPQWDEVGALEGAPNEGPTFIIGEYTFLLEEDDATSRAPQVLALAYHAESNFKAVLVRLNQRSQLWHHYNNLCAATQFKRGESAMPGIASSAALIARLKELTTWLEEDLPETIESFRKLLPELHAMLKARYPKRHFIRLWPNDDPSAPPL